MLAGLLALSGILIMGIATLYEVFKIIDNHEKEMKRLDQKMKYVYDRQIHKDIQETRESLGIDK